MLKKMQEWLGKPVDVKEIDMEPQIKKVSPPKAKKIPVQIIDIDIPFMSMVMFMVKWAFATIPAIIIIWAIVGFISTIILGSFL